MKDIKIGDKVERIHYAHGNFKVGDVGIIKKDVMFSENAVLENDKAGFSHNICNLKLVKEAKMSIKDKIENINEDTTIKELDDLIEKVIKGICCEIKINNFHRDRDGAHIQIYQNSGDDAFNGFPYTDQCSKLQALKDALMWLAKKSGKLKDNKKEIAEVKERMKDYQELYDKTMIAMRDEIERLEE